jgi:phage gpG-like protein
MVIGTSGIKYADIHNRGLRGKAFGKYPFNMPKREFIGKSRELNRKNLLKIERLLNSAFK